MERPMRLLRSGWFISATIAVGFLLAGGLAVGPAPDPAIFTVVGEGVLRGSMPYRDLWDHKPPGVYLVAAAAAALPGSTWPILWAASVAATVAAGYLLRRLTNGWTALLASLGMAAFPAAQGGGLTEPFGAFPAVVALLLASQGRHVWAGAALSVALLCSLQYLAAAIALIVLAPRAVPRMAMGGLVPLVLVAIWLGESLPAAVDALGRYQIAYAALDRTADLDNLPGILVLLSPLLFFAILRGSGMSRIDLAAAAWVVVGIAQIMLQGRLFPHYAVPLLVPIAILAARGIQRIPAARRWVLPALVFVYVVWSQVTAVSTIGAHSIGENRRVAAWLQEHAEPSDRLLMWGHQAVIYLESGLQPAGPYPYLMPLVTPGYSTPSQVEAWVDSLRADPPTIIVDAEAANPYWTADDFLRPPPPGTAGGRDLDLLDPFRSFVRERYRLVAAIEGRKLYALR